MNRREFIKRGVGLATLLLLSQVQGCVPSDKISTRIVHPKFFLPKENLTKEKFMNAYDLVVYDVNSGKETRVTSNNLADGLPIFSQDGKSAMFLRFDGQINEDSRVMKVNLETLAEKEILSFKKNDKDSAINFPNFKNTPPFFSLSSWLNNNEILHDEWTEGIFLAAAGASPKDDSFIYEFNIETKKFEKLFDIPGKYYFSRISPDKKKIVYSSIEKLEKEYTINLYVCNINGSEREKITDYQWNGRFKGKAKEKYLDWLRGMAVLPTWSPDGKEIAYVSGVTGNFEIFKVNLGSGKKIQLTSGEEENWLPIWTKEGIYFIRKQNNILVSEEFEFFKKITSQSRDEAIELFGKREIWRMNANGSNQRKITDTTDIYYGTFDVYSK